MPFPIKVFFYKAYVSFIGLIVKIVGVPKPLVYTGADSLLQLCDNIIYFGHKSVIIVTDAVLHEMGMLDEIKQKFDSSGVKVCVYDGVEPNPTFVHVHAGLDMAKANNCDAVLVVGGGSPIDVAKVIAAAATNTGTPESLVGAFKVKKPCLAFYAVPTTAGTGSEMSIAAVVSDPVTHKKGFVADPKTVPVAVALDPKLMLGLPAPITAVTGMDALTHAVEAYLSTWATNNSDDYALTAVKLIFENLPKAYNVGSDEHAREAMAIASCYAALAFNQSGLGYVHGIAHQFSGYYDTPHGLANSIVLPRILDFLLDVSEHRLAKLAVAIGRANESESSRVRAQKFIDAVRELSASMNIPTTLDSLKAEDIPAIAADALKESHYSYAVPRYMNQQQCEAIISSMRS